VDVIVDEKLARFKKTADEFFRSRPQYKIKIENRPFHPHITIATRDMAKSVFAEAWPLFKDKEHQAEWEASGLSVLRHNQKNWDVIHTSQFQKR
jgi:2'-5' RNA ligase